LGNYLLNLSENLISARQKITKEIQNYIKIHPSLSLDVLGFGISIPLVDDVLHVG